MRIRKERRVFSNVEDNDAELEKRRGLKKAGAGKESSRKARRGERRSGIKGWPEAHDRKSKVAGRPSQGRADDGLHTIAGGRKEEYSPSLPQDR